MSTIYLLRHGQASFDAADYDQLSTRGHEQARRLGDALAACGLRAPVLVSGGMQRHLQTLHGCTQALGLADQAVEMDTDWNEFDHLGIIQTAFPQYRDIARLRADMAQDANPKAAFQRMFSSAVARWVGGEHDADYVENWTQFCIRVEHAWDRLVQQLPPDRDAVVSTSGGPIAVVIKRLLQLPTAQAVSLNWSIVNASYTRLRTGRIAPRLCCFNVHAHLEAHADLLTYR